MIKTILHSHQSFQVFLNIMSDGKIEYKTEGRQILVQVQVQIDINTCKYCTCYCVHFICTNV